jgi:hypothetical protein
VATALSQVLTISIPGVSMWCKAVPIVQRLQARHLLLAFDADWRTNHHVAQALGHAAYAMLKAGYQVEVETWQPALGKGIDDVLAAGHTPARQSSTLAFAASLRRQARVWTGSLPTIAAEEVPSWRSSR